MKIIMNKGVSKETERYPPTQRGTPLQAILGTLVCMGTGILVMYMFECVYIGFIGFICYQFIFSLYAYILFRVNA